MLVKFCSFRVAIYESICFTDFWSKAYFFCIADVKQPEIEKNLESAKQTQEENVAESTNTNKSQKRGSSKVMKGQWIVKLERIDVSEFVENK